MRARVYIVVGCLVVSAGFGVLAGLGVICWMTLPQIDELDHYRPIFDTVLYDSSGRPYAFFALQHRKIAQFEDFPKVLYDAVLSIEDRNFEQHGGIDTLRLISVAGRNI